MLGHDMSETMLRRVSIATPAEPQRSTGLALLELLGVQRVSSFLSLINSIKPDDFFDTVIASEPALETAEIGYARPPFSADALRVLRLVRARVTANLKAGRMSPSKPRALFIYRSQNRKFLGLTDDHAALVSKEVQRSLSLGLVVEFVDFAAVSFSTQVVLVSNSRVIAGMHGAGLVNFFYASYCSVCVQMLSFGMVKYYPSRSVFKNVAIASECIYAEYEFPAAQTHYPVGTVQEPLLYQHADGNQVYDLLNADVVVTAQDFIGVLKRAKNAANAAQCHTGWQRPL